MTEIVHRLWQILGLIEKEGRTLQAVMQRLFPGQGAVTPQWLESLLATVHIRCLALWLAIS